MSGDRRDRLACWILGHRWRFLAVDRRPALYLEAWGCRRCGAALTVRRQSAVMGQIPPPIGGILEPTNLDRLVYAAMVIVLLAIAGSLILAGIRVR